MSKKLDFPGGDVPSFNNAARSNGIFLRTIRKNWDQYFSNLLFLGLNSVVLLAVIVSACSTGSKPTKSKYSKRVIGFNQPVPKGGGRYKVGKPYKIAGKWYHPREDWHYDRTGVASWYGELFHGRYTANREIYDMNALTAAHPTLPLPVYVKVTNLNNGRSLIVRVNDRGPYKHNRIIDLSKKSATLLGFKIQGTARVRVKFIAKAPINGDDQFERRYLARQPWVRSRFARLPLADPITVASLPNVKPRAGTLDTFALRKNPELLKSGRLDPHRVDQVITGAPYKTVNREIYVQTGVFGNRQNAERLSVRLSALGDVQIDPVLSGEKIHYRVTVGPYDQAHKARQMIKSLKNAGIQDAILIGQ